MNKESFSYKDLLFAKAVLGIADRASLKEIKQSYYFLLKKWHPDRCQESEEICNEMTQKITKAYSIVLKYFEEYKLDFSVEKLRRYLSPKEWWDERFGDDPLWGKSKD